MLRVEMSEIGHEVLDHRHMRQGIDSDGLGRVIGMLGAGKRVGAADIHRA
jgi:hypothetical protein